MVSEDDSAYVNMWALPQYEYVPETTEKLYFESSGEGHGSSVYPSGDVALFALYWLNYYLLEDDSFCDILIEAPESTSQFMTTLSCDFSISYDVNNDGLINSSDLTSLMTYILYESGSLNPLDLNFDQSFDILDILKFADYLENL